MKVELNLKNLSVLEVKPLSVTAMVVGCGVGHLLFVVVGVGHTVKYLLCEDVREHVECFVDVYCH